MTQAFAPSAASRAISLSNGSSVKSSANDMYSAARATDESTARSRSKESKIACVLPSSKSRLRMRREIETSPRVCLQRPLTHQDRAILPVKPLLVEVGSLEIEYEALRFRLSPPPDAPMSEQGDQCSWRCS